METEIRSQVRAAANRMRAARARAEYYRTAVLPLQAKIVQQTQLQFNGMFIGVFQLLQAKQAQIDAGRGYIQSLQNYWMARSELEKTVGGSLQSLPTEMPATMPATLPSTTQPAGSEMPPGEGQPHHHHHGS